MSASCFPESLVSNDFLLRETENLFFGGAIFVLR